MSAVIVHLGHDKPHTLCRNRLTTITHLGYRIWEALVWKSCHPTARAVAAKFRVHPDTANRALNNLIDHGLLWRTRPRSGGPGLFAWAFIVTDEPFAWEDDATLMDKALCAQEAELERLRTFRKRRRRRDAEDADAEHGSVVPVPEPDQPPPPDPGCPQDQQVVSCPKNPDVTNKNSLEEISSPTPSPVDEVIHSPRRFTDRRLATVHRLIATLHADRTLEPHVPDALALLHGLGFPPVSRLRHALVVARALRSGRSVATLTTFLTSAMSTARQPRAVMVYRLRRLQATLDQERQRTPGATPTRQSSRPNGSCV